MEFNFNGHGSYTLSKQAFQRDAIQLTHQNGSNIQINEHDAPKPNAAYIHQETDNPWWLKPNQEDDIRDAFHMAGMLAEKLFPELSGQKIAFIRHRHSVQAVIGDISEDNPQQYSSSYSPTKTFANDLMGGMEITLPNQRLLSEEEKDDLYLSSLFYAICALENVAHGKKVPKSFAVTPLQLKAA